MRTAQTSLKLCLLFVGLAVWFTFASTPKVAPEISGIDTTGKRFDLNDYRGQVVLLTFWADS